MKRSLHRLHKDCDFGSGIWGKSTAQHTQSIMETRHNGEEETAGQHRGHDFKEETGWNGQTHFYYTEVTGIIFQKQNVVFIA